MKGNFKVRKQTVRKITAIFISILFMLSIAATAYDFSLSARISLATENATANTTASDDFFESNRDRTSDDRFIAWFTDEENADTILTTLSDDTTEDYQKLYSRICEVTGERDERAATVTAYLNQLRAAKDDESDYIYFDLAAGNVTITAKQYTGYIYRKGTKTRITGTHDEENRYYVYQSTVANRAATGETDDGMVVPSYPAMTKDGVAWGEYITDNRNVEEVIETWESVADTAGRTKTTNKITISGTSDYNVLIDNLYAGNQADKKTTGPIVVDATSGGHTTLRVKGDNRLRNLYYDCRYQDTGSLTVTSYLGNGYNDGTLTVSDLTTDMTEHPDCLTMIGPSSQNEYGLTFSGATVFAGFAAQDNRVWGARKTVNFPVCVGGGDNSIGEVIVTGGRLTAVSNGTTPALGGGGGYAYAGGYGIVNISGGAVYAYANGIYSLDAQHTGFVPTTAIGGASTFKRKAYDGTDIDITGGYVYAESLGGTAIGGGNSMNAQGGGATVDITGGKIRAISATGVANNGEYKVSAGNAIGGGVGYKGGDAEVSVSGGTIEATAVGGGTGSGGNGGSAEVSVSGGTMILQNGIGGGDSAEANGGSAVIQMTGGTLNAGKSIGGGKGVNGGAADITVRDGTIQTGTIGGGDTNDEENGSVGYATADISGGDITGQFLLKSGSSTASTFTMTGGLLHDGGRNETYPNRKANGGAIWMEDENGVVNISGGTIQNCSATDGGAVYMTNGTCTLSGTGRIESCSASDKGGAVYMAAGTFTQTGGTIQSCTASGNGGGVYIDGGKIRELGGSIQNCSAWDGGALYVSGFDEENAVSHTSAAADDEDITDNASIDPAYYTVYVFGATLSGNTAAANGGAISVNNGHVLMDGGTITGNRANGGDGGAIYLAADAKADAVVRVRSGVLTDNYASVSGGAIAVSGESVVAASGESEATLKVTIGVHAEHVIQDGAAVCDHINQPNVQTLCPILANNTAAESGGAIFISGQNQSYLSIYCMTEEGNSAESDDDRSDFLMVKGGDVYITSGTKHSNGNGSMGYADIADSVHVVGGRMDIYGTMENPRIDAAITVDITDSENDWFVDHRENVKTGDEKIYWVHYYENFADENGKVSGQYTAYPVDISTDFTHTILGVIYRHAGYNILEWNTIASPTSANAGSEYAVGQTYTFPADVLKDLVRLQYDEDKNAVFDADEGGSFLILYAIWSPNRYTVSFNANVPAGVVYSGEMEAQNMEFNQSVALSRNQFAYQSYFFLHWNTASDDSGATYEDGGTVYNLTDQNGGVVVLYAIWKLCSHDGESNAVYTYSASGGVLIAACSCKGYEEKVTVTVPEARTYTGEAVEATLQRQNCNYSLLKDITLSYLQDGVALSGAPVNAGVLSEDGEKTYTAYVYTAYVAANGAQASITYSIERAKGALPERPSYTVEDGKAVIVAQGGLIGAEYEYSVRYYEDGQSDVLQELPWQSDNAVVLPQACTTYFVYIRYAETGNILPSEGVRAWDSFYFSAEDADVRIIIKCDEGVLHDFDAQNSSLAAGIAFHAIAEEGYYLLSAFQATVQTEGGGEAVLANYAAYTGNGRYGYLLESIPAYGTVTVTLTGAQKAATVTAKTDGGEVFGTVNNSSACVIGRTAAFTVAFTVNDYNKYSGLSLRSSGALPAGTKIILLDKANSSYWYYITGTTLSSLPLTSFMAMGGSGETFVVGEDTLQYQFIVNFSAVENFAAESVTIFLAAEKDAGETNQPALPSVAGMVGLTDETFALTAGEESGTKNALGVDFATSEEGGTSAWEEQSGILVFAQAEESEELPSDAHLEVKQQRGGAVYTAVYYANEAGVYVVPLLDGAADMSVELKSDMFGGTEYKMDVTLYASRSACGTAYGNAQKMATAQLTFAVTATGAGAGSGSGTGSGAGTGVVGATPSLKVTADNRLLQADALASSTLDVKIEGKNLEEYTVRGTVYRNGENGYSSTAQKFTVDLSALENGVYKISLAGQQEGSFYVLFEVISTDGTVLLKTPLYFIIR